MFKKIEFLVILISFIFTILVSTTIGFAGFLILEKFWGFFILSFILQLVIFAIVNTILQKRDLLESTKILNEHLEAVSKHSINLSCAYCQIANVVPIVLNKENKFKCESCNQISGVKMQFLSTQISTPLTKITFPGMEDV
jgi:hypothetical protein